MQIYAGGEAMSMTHNTAQDKQGDQGRQNTEAAKANLNRTAEQAARPLVREQDPAVERNGEQGVRGCQQQVARQFDGGIQHNHAASAHSRLRARTNARRAAG